MLAALAEKIKPPNLKCCFLKAGEWLRTMVVIFSTATSPTIPTRFSSNPQSERWTLCCTGGRFCLWSRPKDWQHSSLETSLSAQCRLLNQYLLAVLATFLAEVVEVVVEVVAEVVADQPPYV